MPMRAVALAMLLCFPAFAQQKPSLLPADEQPLPLAVAPIEHSASWQFAGLLEGIVTGALLFSLTALATRNQSSGLTKADDAIVGGWTAFGATLFGAAGAWLGDAAREDDSGAGDASRQVIRWHGALLATGVTAATVLTVVAVILISASHNEPTQNR